MKLFIILSVFTVAQASVVKWSCDGVYINNAYYEKKVLKTGLDRPFMLTTNFKTDNLYFTYKDGVYKSARYDLRKDEMRPVAVPNGFSYAIDQNNQTVYVGTSNGIYKYDEATNKAEYLTANNSDIWTMYFKDNLYFSQYPSQNFYVYVNGEVRRYTGVDSPKIHYFLIDKDDDVFYSNNLGLYHQKGSNATLIDKFGNGWDLRALTTDVHGNVYACLDNGIYTVKMVNGPVKLNKVHDLYDCFGLAFDSEDNIIHSDSTTLYKYTLKKEGC